MNTNKQKRILRKALRELRTRVQLGEEIRFGICYNADEIVLDLLKDKGYGPDERDEFACQIVDDLLPLYFYTWPHYSGSSCYPVPAGEDHVDPDEAFTRLTDTIHRDQYWHGPYGNLRLDLLNHCIDELTKELS